MAKKLGEMFLRNDKYRCALIRINPVKERWSQYEDEKTYFTELIKRQRQRARLPEHGRDKAEVPELLASQVRNKLYDDNRHLVLEEERSIALLKNQLIEI